MIAGSPQARHRGFFLHSETGELDTAEHEAPEGVAVRAPFSKHAVRRHAAGPTDIGRSRAVVDQADESRPGARSGSVTGSRQRAHLPR